MPDGGRGGVVCFFGFGCGVRVYVRAVVSYCSPYVYFTKGLLFLVSYVCLWEGRSTHHFLGVLETAG